MVKSNKSDLEEKDRPAEKVTKFLSLYDKGNKGYKKKDWKKKK